MHKRHTSRQTAVGAGDRQRSIGFGQQHVIRVRGREARPERPTLSSVTPAGQLVRACCCDAFSRLRVKAAYTKTRPRPHVSGCTRTHQAENPVELVARYTTPRRDAHPNDRRTIVFDRSSARAQHAYARAAYTDRRNRNFATP